MTLGFNHLAACLAQDRACDSMAHASLPLKQTNKPCRWCVIARRRHTSVVDGGRVVEVGPGKVFVSGRGSHRGQPEIPEFSFSFFRDQRYHAPALELGKQY